MIILLLFRLLDILAGHKSRKGLTGEVLINGKQQPANFKYRSAYVVKVNLTLCIHVEVWLLIISLCISIALQLEFLFQFL